MARGPAAGRAVVGVFHFRLEPLLEQARQRESQEREVFDREFACLRSAQNDLSELERAFDARAAAARTADLNVRSMHLFYGCAEETARRIQEARRRVTSCCESSDGARERFYQTRALRKTLEALKSRQHLRHRRADESLEERALEEVNSARMSATERS